MTVKEKRKNAIMEIAKRRYDNPTEEQIIQVRSLMNSLYRLRGLATRNLEYSNNESTCNKAWVKYSEERELKWFQRLKSRFAEYDIICAYAGWCPDLYEKANENGALRDLYLTYDY